MVLASPRCPEHRNERPWRTDNPATLTLRRSAGRLRHALERPRPDLGIVERSFHVDADVYDRSYSHDGGSGPLAFRCRRLRTVDDSHEAVARLRHRLDHAWRPGRIVEDPPELDHSSRQGVVRHERAAPHRTHELRPRDDGAGFPRQRQEHLQGARLQPALLAATQQTVSGPVDRPSIDVERAGPRLRHGPRVPQR